MNGIELLAQGIKKQLSQRNAHTDEDCYRAGFACGCIGPNAENTHYSFFLDEGHRERWERGLKDGTKVRETPLTFGQYNGLPLCSPQIPDDYVAWVAGRGRYADENNRFETRWKVPIVLAVLARREMERREYRSDGEDFVKEEVRK